MERSELVRKAFLAMSGYSEYDTNKALQVFIDNIDNVINCTGHYEIKKSFRKEA